MSPAPRRSRQIPPLTPAGTPATFSLGMRSFAGKSYEVAVVGCGPAGLAAAVYLARFLRSCIVFDSGDARAKLIPKTRNCPGFPQGISGKSLLKRLKQQAVNYGSRIVQGSVKRLDKEQGKFVLQTSLGAVHARFVILATGVVDRAPAIPNIKRAIERGSVRLCPVCDAYEVRGRRVGVIGPEEDALRESIFLKDFTPHVSILCNFQSDISTGGRRRARQAGVEIWDAVDDVLPHPCGFELSMVGGGLVPIDVIYPCMGCDVRSELALSIGAECDDEGYILVGTHLETTIPRLYAIGDVAKALNQIAVGFGHAALAATHIHNELRRFEADRKRSFSR